MHSVDAENPRRKFSFQAAKKPVTPGAEPVTLSPMHSEPITITVQVSPGDLKTIRSQGFWHKGITDSALIASLVKIEAETIEKEKKLKA